jgi:hypothetical protein
VEIQLAVIIVDKIMILPPFFGSATKSDDRSWESMRCSYIGIDTLIFPLPELFIRLSYLGMDCLNFKLPDKLINMTYGAIDTMTYELPNKKLHYTYIGIDLLTYEVL